ncbi:MAG: methyltransferase domain-containing protein [Deltaproteobacteria bacterium]|nr:methyltransferase domain-containing protein [Deltaproteobacteria bacterium]MBW2588706.1 methyltransferase domain-containing protein [Deltaproteobacteria bacterium]
MSAVDTHAVETKVKDMYERVAQDPHGEFHFEMGRALAERLGYSPYDLDRVPAPSMDSFAGVGHHFDLAALQSGERVLDLGSGSGLDSFVASLKVGATGTVVGIDMTVAQLDKANELRQQGGFLNVEYVHGYIDQLPFEDESFDAVISNGVINLVADKDNTFKQAARVLKRGGRLALSDIVTGVQLPQGIVCDATLWAACIGGAMHRDSYQQAIVDAGLTIEVVQPNPQYRFISDQANGATTKYEVQSISLVAVKP